MYQRIFPKFVTFTLAIILLHADVSLEDHKEIEESLQAKCECGISKYRQTRIVGGRETKSLAYPWMVTLALKNGNHNFVHCGASVISSTYILTAAHCILNMDWFFGLIKMTFVANVGDHDVSTTIDADNDIIAIRKKIQHPGFNETTLENDIALLELQQKITFGQNLWPVCLPSSNMSLEGKSVIVTGWGNLEKGGLKSDTLQEVSMPVVPKMICQDRFGNKTTIRDYHFCAGLGDGSQDACQGDSGGPAIYQCDKYDIQVGVTSYGVGCASKKYPGVYVYVPYYIEWIKANTGLDPPCYRDCNT